MGSYEGTTDLRLLMPDYYGLVATFSLMERENIDDLEVQRGRRRVHLFLQMTVPVVVQARFAKLTPFLELEMSGGTLGDLLGATAIVAAAHSGGGETALAAMGLTVALARQIARATLGITPAEADALTIDYLVQLCLVLAQQNASLETWYGKPPYSPGETAAHKVLANLPRLKLP